MSVVFPMKIDLGDGKGFIDRRFYCGMVSNKADCQIFDADTKQRLCGKMPSSTRAVILNKALYWLKR